MKDQAAAPLTKVKEFWTNQPAPRKKIFIFGAAFIVIAAILFTVYLNNTGSGYKVLYPGLDASEMPKVYSAVQELEVQPQINAAGELTVPEEKYDFLLFQLAAKGFPKSTLTYDVFYEHNSLTSTEFDKKTALVQDLQDRMQGTLSHVDGVAGADVTIVIPETSEYVWSQATEKDDSSASVLLTLKEDVTFNEDQVAAVKNLVASGTPKLLPENVKVINAATGLEMDGPVDSGDGTIAGGGSAAFKLEQKVQKQIEDNVTNLLKARYGSSGVAASAKVTLDFDKMKTEQKELQPQEDGNGAITKEQEQYGINGVVGAGGLVGEEDNTDVPTYPYGDPNAQGGVTDYNHLTEREYGYILTQIERGNAVIKRATISVLVNDRLTDANVASLTDLISKATDIPVDLISLGSMNLPEIDIPEPEKPLIPEGLTTQQLIIIAVGILFIFLMIGITIYIILRKRAKKHALAVVEEKEEEFQDQAKNLQAEINEYKKQLEEAARASIDPKDDAIADGVRDFAKENPEITATLLRSWLKEDE